MLLNREYQCDEKMNLPFLAAIIAGSRLCRVGTFLLVVADEESAKRFKIMN
jgi:hypothetical protein